MKIFTSIFLLLIAMHVNGQQFQWVQSDTLSNQLNPSNLKAIASVDYNGNPVISKMTVRQMYYGQDVYGTYEVRKMDEAGIQLWSFFLDDSTVVTHLECDRAGNTYVAGSFMGDITLSNGMNFPNTLPAAMWNVDYFLLKIDPSGNLSWFKNISANSIAFSSLTTISIDQADQLWFVVNDFMDAYVIKADANGDPVDSTVIQGIRVLSSIGFDEAGSMYIAGATQNGTMTAGGVSTIITEGYAFYLLKLNAAFQQEWLKVAHDVTFHSPQVIVDSGAVYIASSLMDSTAWDALQFHAPQWSMDGFLVKFYLNGNAEWGMQTPLQSPLTGRFDPSPGKTIAVDHRHNVYFYGTINGSIDWGNGVTGGLSTNGDMLHILALNSSGIAQWSKTFGATGYGNYPWSIDSRMTDAIYCMQMITNSGTFDSLTVPGTQYLQTYVYGKIDLTNIQTGINTAAEQMMSLIYPNPALSTVTVPATWIGKLVSVFSHEGKLVKTYFAKGNTILVEDLSCGMYIVRCEKESQKLMISK